MGTLLKRAKGGAGVGPWSSPMIAAGLRRRAKSVPLSQWERIQAMDRLSLLKNLSFGTQVAEEEVKSLADYFVKTDQWNRILRGEVDIVRGEKGAGKSALYLLLTKHEDALFDSGILLVNGENPRGTTVFKDIIVTPPASEAEFVVLWKVYILVIVCHKLNDLGFHGGDFEDVYLCLQDARLMERELNLPSILRAAQNFAKRLINFKSAEAGLGLDPVTAIPNSVTGKITLDEPSYDLRSKGFYSIDGLFQKINESLECAGYSVWVLLDRLDVAFAESHELEANALRGLFKVYGDLRSLDQISLKIFLREDIWKRINAAGFREASHIVKYETLSWNEATLLNLLVRRMLNNKPLLEALGIRAEDVLNDAQEQEKFFVRMFPPQVEQGPQKAKTLKWMVTRCADSTGNTAPRELIHLLNMIKDEEIRRLERGHGKPPGDQLFDRSVFKAALPEVSTTRLHTYLYAEYPSQRPFVEKLDGQKTEQTPESLSEIWELTPAQAVSKAKELVEVGLFEARGDRSAPTFWVPFLYRDALHMRQGRAEMEVEEG